MIALLLAAAVVTQPVQIEIHYMAPGVKAWIPPPVNGWGKGFTFEEYKKLLEMDGDLHVARQQLKLVEDLKLNWEALLQDKDELITNYKEVTAIRVTRETRLNENWKTCEKALVKESGGDYLPWIIAGVGAGIGIAGAGVAIGVALSK